MKSDKQEDQAQTGQPIEVKSSGVKSPDDLQAEIEAKAESAAKTPEAVAESLKNSKSSKIEVTVNPEGKPTAKLVGSMAKETDSKTIDVKPDAKPKNVAENSDPKDKLTSHKAKMLNPIGGPKAGETAVEGTADSEPKDSDKPEDKDGLSKAEDTSKAPSEKKLEIKPASQSSQSNSSDDELSKNKQEITTKSTDDSSAEDSSDQSGGGDTAADKLDAMSGELKAREDEKKAKNNDVQQPQIFDTDKYHLPIKASHHHRKHAISPLITGVIMVVALLVIGAAAISTDIVDPGFEIPYLNEKETAVEEPTQPEENIESEEPQEESANEIESIVLARNAERQSDVNSLAAALEQFFAENGYYPLDLDALATQDGLDPQAFIAPNADSDNEVYVYRALTVSGSECDNSTQEQCLKFTITASLENDQGEYLKESLN